MKRLYLGLSFTFFFSSVMNIAHFWWRACSVKPKPESPHRRHFRAKSYVIHTLLLCDWSVEQSTNKPQTQKECGSVVSSRFSGESVTWHPKKTLQRSLIETLLELIMKKACFLTLKSLDTHTYKTSPLGDLPFDCPEILPSEMSCGYPLGRSHEENNCDHNYENILWSTSIMIMNW